MRIALIILAMLTALLLIENRGLYKRQQEIEIMAKKGIWPPKAK